MKIDEKAHNILFVDGITKEINEKTIKDLFSEGFSGLKSVKLFASRGMCFVEYDNILDAMKAKEKFDKIKLKDEAFNKRLKDAGINETVNTLKGNSKKLKSLPEDLRTKYDSIRG